MAHVFQKVLSNSVSKALEYFGDPSTLETQKFTGLFDRMFDCLNVRNTVEWRNKIKPDLKPYSSSSDPRLEVQWTLTHPNPFKLKPH